jgi:steroid delta-isomerase-like uncharacterized protein
MPSPSQAEENKRTARRLVEEFFNAGDATRAAELYTNDYVRHDPGTPDAVKGIDAITQVLTTYRTAFPDLHFVIEDMIGEGDKVVTRWTVTGTHQGDLQGIAPTGNKVELTGISLYRLADGKVAEEWTNWDTGGMMKQLGLA